MSKLTLGLRGSGTLGDSLWLTPPLWVLKDVTIEMHDDEQSRAVSRVFDGLAQVKFVDNPAQKIYEQNKEPTHYAQRVLNTLNIDSVNCIPKIKITKQETEWAVDFLKSYPNPVVVVNDNSGKHDPQNPRATFVCPPDELMQQNVDLLIKSGYTPIQFGRYNEIGKPIRFTPLRNAVYIQGLSVRNLAACYSIIGKYIGGDTGDYHLMLAVGGMAHVYIPVESHSFGYIYNELLYFPQLWKGERIRVTYSIFSKI